MSKKETYKTLIILLLLVAVVALAVAFLVRRSQSEDKDSAAGTSLSNTITEPYTDLGGEVVDQDLSNPFLPSSSIDVPGNCN